MGALNFRSRLAPYIIGLIEQKRALGYKYTAQVKILQKFDMLCAERFSEDSTVTKAMLDVWAVKGPEEAPGTLRHRVTVIAHLAQHIASLGFYAYIYPTNELPKEPKYNPYIFSGDELTRFFRQVDCCHFSSEVPNRHTNIELSDICPLAKAGQPFEVARENTCEECKYFCRIHYEVDPEYGDKQVHFWMNEEIVTFF